MSEYGFSFFSSDTFWALIALVLFLLLLLYLKVPRWVIKSLDMRAERISSELNEARCLREQAQVLLAEYQQKRVEAQKDAEDIVSSAQREAKAITSEAHKRAETYVERRQKMAEQKIHQAEADAMAEVRSTAVDMAVAAAGKLIESELSPKAVETLFDESLSQVKSRLNAQDR